MTKHSPIAPPAQRKPSARTAFKITARQARDLVNITPPGYVAEVRVAFVPEKPVPSAKTEGKECDDVFGTGQSD